MDCVTTRSVELAFAGRSSVTGCSFLFGGSQGIPSRASNRAMARVGCTREVGGLLGLYCNFLPRGKRLGRVCVARQGSDGFISVMFPSFVVGRGGFQSAVRVRRSALAQR